MLSLTYDTSPAAIQVFIDGLKQITIKYPVVVEEKNQIYLYQLADSSINIQFCVFFVLKYGDDEFAIREELLFQVIRLAEFLDIRFAFPTQTIHVENMPGQIGLTPTAKNDDKNLRGRLETFMSSVTPSSPSA
jgi:MscS family membrane protein